MKIAAIDASFCLCFLLPDESDTQVDHVFIEFGQGELQLIAPRILPFEIANALLAAVHRKRLTFIQSQQALTQFLSMGILFLDTQFDHALSIAEMYHLSLYDASYIELALRKKSSLFTLDKQLKKSMDSLDKNVRS